MPLQHLWFENALHYFVVLSCTQLSAHSTPQYSPSQTRCREWCRNWPIWLYFLKSFCLNLRAGFHREVNSIGDHSVIIAVPYLAECIIAGKIDRIVGP